MPQASDELRQTMDGYFSNGGISDSEPTEFLLSQGWTEDRYLWKSPSTHTPTQKEWDCLQFLLEEWDHDYDARSCRL